MRTPNQTNSRLTHYHLLIQSINRKTKLSITFWNKTNFAVRPAMFATAKLSFKNRNETTGRSMKACVHQTKLVHDSHRIIKQQKFTCLLIQSINRKTTCEIPIQNCFWYTTLFSLHFHWTPNAAEYPEGMSEKVRSKHRSQKENARPAVISSWLHVRSVWASALDLRPLHCQSKDETR